MEPFSFFRRDWVVDKKMVKDVRLLDHHKIENDWAAIFCEFIASFFLTFISCGSVCMSNFISLGNGGGNTGVLFNQALTQGVAYMALLVFSAGSTTYGIGFANPAITLACLLTNRATGVYQWKGGPVWRALLFIIAQFSGGILGALCVKYIVPEALLWEEKLGGPRVAYGAEGKSAFLFEALGCFFLTWIAITNSANRSRISRNVAAPFAVGFAYTALVVVAHSFSGGSFNPVRTISPFIISWDFPQFWLLLFIAPFVGGVLAALAHAVACTNKPLYACIGFSVPDDWEMDALRIMASLKTPDETEKKST